LRRGGCTFSALSGFVRRDKDPRTLEETREVRILMRNRRVHQNLLDDAGAPVVGVKVARRRLS
jgi:hypothetical protein